MTSSGSIKTKIYKWRLVLAILLYKIEDHQDFSSLWKWRIFPFSSMMKCKSLQMYFILSALKHSCNLCCNAVIDKITHRANRIQWGIAKLSFYIFWWRGVACNQTKRFSIMGFTKFYLFDESNDHFLICEP